MKEYFICMIEEYFRKYTPEEIYYKYSMNCSRQTLNWIAYPLIISRICHCYRPARYGERCSTINKRVFISLIKMLRKYNGAILADAVGLGKTFSALAVIKFFQIQGYTTVLFCPKKLQQNWTQYLKGAGSRFDKDRFDYQVRFHTDLQNERLQNSYDTYKLDYLQRREKLLIVIDESHNLRNEKSGR